MEARGAAANHLKTWTCERLTARDGEALKRASVSQCERNGKQRSRTGPAKVVTDHMLSSPPWGEGA